MSETDATTADTAVLSPLQEDAGHAPAGPRIRWAGIAWGTIFCAIGLTTMLIAGSPARRDGFGDWIGQLGVGGIVLVGVLALGILILILGILAVIRRAQTPRAG